MCQNYTSALVSDNTDKVLVIDARCKSWFCPECAKLNQKRWRAVLIDYINKHPDYVWCFFTLTAHEKAKDSQYSLTNIRRAWDRLVKRLKRKYGKFQYVRVYEKHQSGRYHLHAIASFHFEDIVTRNRGKPTAYTDSPTLRKMARSLGLGYMTSADDLNAAIASVGYVTKYMTKMFARDREAWGRIRRIQTSQDIHYTSPKSESEYQWKMVSAVFVKDFYHYINQNKPVILLSHGSIELSTDHFLEYPYYPPDWTDEAE